MDDQEKQTIVNISLEYWREAYEAKKPIIRLWDKIWNLYNNTYDFSKKAEWQSKIFIPKISNAVRTGAAVLKNALIRARDFFVVEATTKEAEPFAPAIQTVLKYWLEILQFVHLFSEAVTNALLTNLIIFKVFWKQSTPIESTVLPPKSEASDILKKGKKPEMSVEEQFFQAQLPEMIGTVMPEMSEVSEALQKVETETLRVVIVDPYDFLLDPTGRRKYCIHRTKEDLGDLKDMGKDAGYDMQVLDSIKEDYRKIEFDYKEQLRKGHAPQVAKPSFRKQVELQEFWGDIFNEEGDILYRNVTWTIANEKYLLRAPTPNPFLHKKWPFVWGPIVKKPFSVYHKNLIEDVIGLATGITDLMNLSMDSNAFATAKAFEIDIDLVYDPEELKSGIYPGKTFKKRSGGANVPLIKEISLGNVSPQILRLYQELDREFQNSTGLTEFLMGKPPTRGRPTATEVSIKTQQSSTIMEDLALDIEDNVLAPLLDMIYKVILQYQRNFKDIRLQQVSADMIDKLNYIVTLPEREKQKYVDIFNFKVRGLSGVISRQAELEKILTFMQFTGENETIMEQIDIQRLLNQIIKAFSWDPADILLPPEQVQQIRAQKEQMRALAETQKGREATPKTEERG